MDQVRGAHQYHSILEELDISSNEIAVADLRSYLIRRWEDRKLINACKAEQLVADILREHLSCDVYHVSANTNAADGGIDLFLCADGKNLKTAIQVKRRVTQAVELVGEIRSFVGALIIQGYRRGIFVTTASRFSRAAKATVNAPGLKRHRLELELIDAERLLDLLKVTTPESKLKLPEGINGSTMWSSMDGTESSTLSLLNAMEKSS